MMFTQQWIEHVIQLESAIIAVECGEYNISTAMRPTNTLKSILVQPKDKKDLSENSDVGLSHAKHVINLTDLSPIWGASKRT